MLYRSDETGLEEHLPPPSITFLRQEQVDYWWCSARYRRWQREREATYQRQLGEHQQEHQRQVAEQDRLIKRSTSPYLPAVVGQTEEGRRYAPGQPGAQG